MRAQPTQALAVLQVKHPASAHSRRRANPIYSTRGKGTGARLLNTRMGCTVLRAARAQHLRCGLTITPTPTNPDPHVHTHTRVYAGAGGGVHELPFEEPAARALPQHQRDAYHAASGGRLALVSNYATLFSRAIARPYRCLSLAAFHSPFIRSPALGTDRRPHPTWLCGEQWRSLFSNFSPSLPPPRVS